ncbi:hypothetical protein D3C78_1351450 [compost metagenome]
MVGAEIARRAALGLGQRAGMVEQRTELRHRHRQVGAQRVLAEELVEGLPHRTLAKSHAAAVARGVPGVVGVGGMLHQGPKERRQQRIEVAARRPCHLSGEKGHGVLEQVEDAAQLVQLGHRLGRRILEGDLLAEGEDRQLRRPHPHRADQLDHVLQQPRVVAGALGGEQNAGQAMLGGRDDTPFAGAGGGQDAEAVLL